MADRSRTAAAAATYDHVCHLLAVSARPDCRSLVTDFSPKSDIFSTQRLSFSDAHALALSAALLVTHAASWPLVRRYLRTYVQHYIPDTLSSFDALAVSPFPSQQSQFARSSILSSSNSNTPYTANFSFNSELTSQGAAAIFAACLLIPHTINVEVFLNFCSEVSSLPMAPWLPLLRIERERPERRNSCSKITGLCLDACPMRTIDSLALSAFKDIAWISMRCTQLSNLWRTLELLDALPTLTAALFSGNVCDEKALQRTRRFSNSRLRDNGSHQMKLPKPHSEESHSLPSSLAKSSRDHHQSTVAHLEIYGYLRSAAQTPVSLVPQFRTFLLAASRTALKLLDGETISAGERDHALRSFQQYFDHPIVSDSRPQNRSIANLLKTRECGVVPKMAVSSSYSSHTERPQKRRRRGYSAQPVTDIMAAVAAAGLPTAGGPGKLNPSMSLTVALAATASVENTHRQVSQNLSRVREAALSIQKASEHERLSMLTSRWKQKPKRKPLLEGFAGYCEDGFERCMSAALINRRGGPRVQYLCPGSDRPRQFEFNPANPSELVYGTEHGYLVVIDEMSGVVKGSCVSGGGSGNRPTGDLICRTSSLEARSGHGRSGQTYDSNSQSVAVYGVSWLNTTSNLFISGVNSGAIHLYDVTRMGNGIGGGCRYACETFDGLTSLHVSSDDVRFAVSGITQDVGLFDLETGKRQETMANCHAESVNVIKFAHHNPNILLTSSFDRCVKKWDLRESRPGGGRRPIFTTISRTDNVMACFSPDDSYLLVSAVDNEVRQYTACDGRLEREFRIPKRGSQYNFTRSYYMNDRDYIVTGSCQENVVRVYNARTGAFFTEVDMDTRDASRSMNYCVQTLRANPSRRFNFSAILASPADSANEMIASVDLHSR